LRGDGVVADKRKEGRRPFSCKSQRDKKKREKEKNAKKEQGDSTNFL